MIANAALGGAARDVVLHAIALKYFHLPVVHLGGHGHFHDAFRRTQYLAKALVELEVLRRNVKLDLRDAKYIQFFARRYPRNRLGNRFGADGHSDFPPRLCSRCYSAVATVLSCMLAPVRFHAIARTKMQILAVLPR